MNYNFNGTITQNGQPISGGGSLYSHIISGFEFQKSGPYYAMQFCIISTVATPVTSSLSSLIDVLKHGSAPTVIITSSGKYGIYTLQTQSDTSVMFNGIAFADDGTPSQNIIMSITSGSLRTPTDTVTEI